MASSQTYTISELAREFDLTTRAIRFYEDMGLLTPCLLYTSPSPRDVEESRMPSSA